MRRLLCVMVCAAICASVVSAADLGNIAPEFTAAGRADDPAVKAAKDRFFKWGWGLFIHYGLYSGSGEGEWQMHDERIEPDAYYAERLPLFRPKPGCVDEWIALARDAGMKYIVLTTRHHEGYWLGDDFIRAYVDKVRAAGLGVGVYYSVADWSDPDYRGGPADQEAWGRFVGKAHAQLRHLMTDFGKIDYLFYDGCPPPQTWGCFAINAELRRLQPGLLITRCEDDDLKSCEQNAAGGEGLWESCYTLNGSWGYQKHDPAWKAVADVVCKLISIRARGGTMLLNVGPMADGTVQPEAQVRLREIGKWVKANADAFYDVKRDPFGGACYEWMTESGRDPQTVYFQFIRSWGERRLLCGISNKVTRVFFVDTNEDLPFEQDELTRIVSIRGYGYASKGSVPRMAGVTFEGKPVPVPNPCWAKFSPRVSGLKGKIAASRTIVREDVWHGYDRIVFDFEGHTAWVVEPKKGPALGCPWTWTMQWAVAYVDRTGVLDLLAQGWRHVTIDTFDNRMDAEGLRVSREFQRFLVDELGFAPKADLVGMSWGGFFSVRYAATNPDCVAKIYLDAPLLTFACFAPGGASSTPTAVAARIGPWVDRPPEDGDWLADARMPVNMAEKVAAAGIPVLLLYGGQDQTVPPALNCELFAERFKAAGGWIDVRKRGLYGHHPHGEDPGQTDVIANFFKSPVQETTKAAEHPCPVSENVRGHENVEWSRSYAYGLTDETKNLPRVLLVGDSICNGYQGRVREALSGKVNVSYWVSSYCVTSPNYLKFLDIYLREAKYDVVHFNNGLHSLGTSTDAYAKGLEAAFSLIREKQPDAKLVWCSSTPLTNDVKTVKCRELNAAAASVVAKLGGIATDDLFSLLDPLDRTANWSDEYHHREAVQKKESERVSAAVLSALEETVK